jgi:hypothetical protein
VRGVRGEDGARRADLDVVIEQHLLRVRVRSAACPRRAPRARRVWRSGHRHGRGVADIAATPLRQEGVPPGGQGRRGVAAGLRGVGLEMLEASWPKPLLRFEVGRSRRRILHRLPTESLLRHAACEKNVGPWHFDCMMARGRLARPPYRPRLLPPGGHRTRRFGSRSPS